MDNNLVLVRVVNWRNIGIFSAVIVLCTAWTVNQVKALIHTESHSQQRLTQASGLTSQSWQSKAALDSIGNVADFVVLLSRWWEAFRLQGADQVIAVMEFDHIVEKFVFCVQDA